MYGGEVPIYIYTSKTGVPLIRKRLQRVQVRDKTAYRGVRKGEKEKRRRIKRSMGINATEDIDQHYI